MRTRIKICGLTRPEDAVHAARLGADAIGLVFYAHSPRAVSLRKAQQIAEELPIFVSIVGLFVNPSPHEVEEVLGKIRIDALQFHGDEPPHHCNAYPKPYIKGIPMHPEVALETYEHRYENAAALLLDGYQKGIPGGTGSTFDWRRVTGPYSKPIILAGGLTQTNVAQAIATVSPYAVDVSSGVESIQGIKNHEKIAAFIREVNSVSYS